VSCFCCHTREIQLRIIIFCKLFRTDGHSYEGQWARGQQHGRGMEGKRSNLNPVAYVEGKRQGGKPKATEKSVDTHPLSSPAAQAVAAA